MQSEILICKDKQNRIVDCKDIEFPDGSEYKPGTVNLWTEWVSGKGKSYYSRHFIKIGSDMVTEPAPGTMLYTMLTGPATIKKQQYLLELSSRI